MRFVERVLRGFGAQDADGPHRPARPSVPPLLAMGLAVWGACAALWPVLRGVEARACLAAGAGCCAAALAVAVALLVRRRSAAVFCAAAGALLGTSFAFGGAAALHQQQEVLSAHPADEAVLVAEEDASLSAFGARCLFSVRFADGTGGVVQAYLDDAEDLPLFGERFRARVEPSAVSDAASERAWSVGQAAAAALGGMEPLGRDDAMGAVLAVRARAINALAGEGEASAVLQALVCGYCAAYDETLVQQDFTVCGLAHIVAVSGAHLVIVSSFVSVLLQALRLPRGACAALQCLLMLGYLVLAGMPVSAVRAFVMALTLQLSLIAGRRSASLAALGGCVLGMIALDPTTAVSASFALSALSTLGIALFGSLFSCWVRRFFGWLPRVLRDALALTLASAVLAQPYSCALFSQLPLVSPLANALAAPFVGPVCALGIVSGLAASAAPALGGALVAASTVGTEALCAVVSWCARLPFACVPVTLDVAVGLGASIVATCALWRRWPVPRGRVRWGRVLIASVTAALLCAALLVVAPYLKGTQLVMLDVGQGDAFLFQSEGAAVLVDTGASDSRLRAALARQGVRRLDAVVVTHSDDDHCGALLSLRGIVDVGCVAVASDALACPCSSCAQLRADALELVGAEGLVGVERGDLIAAGRFELRAVWPERYEDEGGNADSLCFVAACDADGDGAADARALMVGDAEAEQLDAIIAEEGLGRIDILKVGHHGSKKAFDADQLARLDPALALISVGENNRYGHPAAEITGMLAQQGVAAFRTDQAGDVSCRFADGSIEVSTLR